MAILNPNEPLGLPPGSIRSLIAAAFTFVTLYLFATSTNVPETLLAINTLIIGNYFGFRQAAESTPVVVEPSLGAPYIPGDDVE